MNASTDRPRLSAWLPRNSSSSSFAFPTCALPPIFADSLFLPLSPFGFPPLPYRSLPLPSSTRARSPAPAFLQCARKRASACRASEFFAFYRFIIKAGLLRPAPEFGGSGRDTGHAVESRRPFRMYEPVFVLPLPPDTPQYRPDPAAPRRAGSGRARCPGVRLFSPCRSSFLLESRPSVHPSILPRIDEGPTISPLSWGIRFVRAGIPALEAGIVRGLGPRVQTFGQPVGGRMIKTFVNGSGQLRGNMAPNWATLKSQKSRWSIPAILSLRFRRAGPLSR